MRLIKANGLIVNLTCLKLSLSGRNQDLSGANSQRRTSVPERNQDLSGVDSERRTSVLDRNQDLSGADSQRRTSVPEINQDLSGADSERRTSVLDRNQDLSGADSQRRTSVLDRFWGIFLPREENSERESRETGQREENLQRQLRELQERGQNSQRQLTEFQQREENSQREFQQREHELQQQLRETRQQLTNCQEQVSELQLSLSTAQQTISELRSQETSDWVISRDEIQITDKCLGRGGWGSVNEGTFCGCTVAVKQIHELILSPHNIHLFEREMNIASKCRHPHLLQFIGATSDEGNPLFVTELMEKSLRTLLEQRQLSEKEIAVISLDVARAINYLHQKKPEPIIHRDVSSANVLLWRQGDQWRGKVSDYGTANFMQQTMTVAPGAMIYSAPEALTSNQTVKVSLREFSRLLFLLMYSSANNGMSSNSVVSSVALSIVITGGKGRKKRRRFNTSLGFSAVIILWCFVVRQLSLVNRGRKGCRVIILT